jgi:hypothetical protein
MSQYPVGDRGLLWTGGNGDSTLAAFERPAPLIDCHPRGALKAQELVKVSAAHQPEAGRDLLALALARGDKAVHDRSVEPCERGGLRDGETVVGTWAAAHSALDPDDVLGGDHHGLSGDGPVHEAPAADAVEEDLAGREGRNVPRVGLGAVDLGDVAGDEAGGEGDRGGVALDVHAPSIATRVVACNPLLHLRCRPVEEDR